MHSLLIVRKHLSEEYVFHRFKEQAEKRGGTLSVVLFSLRSSSCFVRAGFELFPSESFNSLRFKVGIVHIFCVVSAVLIN